MVHRGGTQAKQNCRKNKGSHALVLEHTQISEGLGVDRDGTGRWYTGSVPRHTEMVHILMEHESWMLVHRAATMYTGMIKKACWMDP